MKDDLQDPGWPREAGDIDALPREMEPPPALEARVSRALLVRGLVTPVRYGSGGRFLSKALMPAAALALVSIGFLLGWSTGRGPSTTTVPAEDAATRYALLLYETRCYPRPSGAEELALYDAYSRWVAEARSRRQFVTGEDLAVADGLTLAPAENGPTIERGASVSSASTLSGMFVITARDEEEALSLAESLPHLRRGGHVVIQRVIPTDSPPRAQDEPSVQ